MDTEINEEKKEKRKKRARNDLVPKIRNIDQLLNLRLDTSSDLFKQACENLGVLPEECILKDEEHFVPSKLLKDLSREAQYQHYVSRLLRIVNSVLAERKKLSTISESLLYYYLERKRYDSVSSRNETEHHQELFLTVGTAFVNPQHWMNTSRSKETSSTKEDGFAKTKAMFEKGLKKRVDEYSRARAMSRKIKMRIAEAEQREKERKEKKIAELEQRAKMFETKRVKLKRSNEENVIDRTKRLQKRIAAIDANHKKKEQLEEEMIAQMRKRQARFEKKMESVKRYSSVSRLEQDQKRFGFLNELEQKCIV